MKPLSQLTPADLMEMLKGVDKRTWGKYGILGVIIVLFVIFMVWPAWFERREVRKESSRLEDKIIKVETLRRSKPQMIEEKTKAGEFIQMAKDRLYSADEASLLLGEISRIAEESNVSIVASSPRDVRGDFPEPFNQRYQASVYDFIIEGGYHNLGAFVSRVESNPKLLRIEHFHLRPKGSDAARQVADVTLSAASLKAQRDVPDKSQSRKTAKKK